MFILFGMAVYLSYLCSIVCFIVFSYIFHMFPHSSLIIYFICKSVSSIASLYRNFTTPIFLSTFFAICYIWSSLFLPYPFPFSLSFLPSHLFLLLSLSQFFTSLLQSDLMTWQLLASVCSFLPFQRWTENIALKQESKPATEGHRTTLEIILETGTQISIQQW